MLDGGVDLACLKHLVQGVLANHPPLAFAAGNHLCEFSQIQKVGISDADRALPLALVVVIGTGQIARGGSVVFADVAVIGQGG